MPRVYQAHSPGMLSPGRFRRSPSPSRAPPSPAFLRKKASEKPPREVAAKELQSYLLPAALFPLDAITSFYIDDAGKLTVELRTPKTLHVDGLTVLYSKRITGQVLPGMVYQLKGVKVHSTVLGISVHLRVRKILSRGPVHPHLEVHTGPVHRELRLLKDALPLPRGIVPRSVSH